MKLKILSRKLKILNKNLFMILKNQKEEMKWWENSL